MGIGKGLEAGEQLHEPAETRQGPRQQELQQTEQGPAQIDETVPAIFGIGHRIRLGLRDQRFDAGGEQRRAKRPV